MPINAACGRQPDTSATLDERTHELIVKAINNSASVRPATIRMNGVTFADAYNNPPQMDFGNVPRNSFYGPHYADVDLSLYKNLIQKESLQFKVGAQTFNLFNNPNFATPQNDASLSQGLGVINSDVVAPTSPYGSFGYPGSGRVLVVNGELTF